MHGGAAPQVKAKRLERLAIAQVVGAASPEPITGHDALLDELARTNGHVQQLGRLLETTEHPDTEYPRQQARYMAERAHLSQTAKAIVALGVHERRASLSEMQGAMVVWVLRRVLVNVGLDPSDPAVMAVVREALSAADEVDAQVAVAQGRMP